MNKNYTSVLLMLVLFAMIGILSCSKDDDNGDNTPSAPIPTATIVDASVERLTTNTTISFNISLNRNPTKEATIQFATVDGTAKGGVDYLASSGTVTFPVNERSASIEITINGQNPNIRQNNLNFKIVLSNPVNCKLGDAEADCLIILENGTHLTTSNAGYSTPNQYEGYNMVWNDEFSGNQLNTDFWNYEIGNGIGGWGNNELEFYTSNQKNVFTSEGNLIIEARKETVDKFSYTSARLTTKGKKEFTFGRVDIRAKLPYGKGIWPALWMLGANISNVGWPACGEIDIMELVGNEPFRVHGTVHWKPVSGSSVNKGAKYDLSGTDFSKEFHVFSIVWEQDQIQWYVDDVPFFTFLKSSVGAANYPFNDPHFFIFNVAVGGNWPGSPDNTTVFPQRMFVDYIRVFQK